jgi:hypothetical protein
MVAKPIDKRLKALALLRRRHGHLVLSTLAPNIPNELRTWAWRQREKWRVGTLDEALERQLRTIGFPLEVEECEWELTFSRVLVVHRQTGVLPGLKSEWERWFDRQRELYRRGELPADREKRLRQLGAFEPAKP